MKTKIFLQYLLIFAIFFTGFKPKGIERVWIIGDQFMDSSVQQHFMQEPEKDFYTRTNFEVSVYYTGFSGWQVSYLARLRTALITAINKEWTLPRVIVVVFESDSVNYMVNKDFTSPAQAERFISYLMNEFRKVITAFKEKLPGKAKRHNWPHVLWATPVVHKNFPNKRVREIFSTALEKTALMHTNMSALRLKQVWDQEDHSLVTHDGHRVTNAGYKSYWQALDKTVKFCVKQVISEAASLKRNSSSSARSRKQQYYDRDNDDTRRQYGEYYNHRQDSYSDRYHWNRPQEEQYEQYFTRDQRY